MKRTILVPLSFLFAAALMLTACGSDTTDLSTGNASEQPATSDGDTPVSSDDGTELPVNDGAEPDAEEPILEPGDEPLPLGGGAYPIATLDITITHPGADDVSYTISCLGDTATVIGDVGIDERVACERLADLEVRTRLVDGPPADQVCTEQYGGPDLARITGTYDGVDGVTVDTTIDRVNGCGIGDWDSLLAGVLPRALGITD